MHWRRKLHNHMRAALAEAGVETRPFTLDALDNAQLPAPVARPRRQAAQVERLRGGVGVLGATDLASTLERLTTRSLERAEDILELSIEDENHDKFGEKLRGLNAAIKTVVATQVRVDEHRLKARKLDVLPELLEIIAEEERKRKLVDVTP